MTPYTTYTLRNLTDSEFVRAISDSDHPVYIEAANRLEQYIMNQSECDEHINMIVGGIEAKICQRLTNELAPRLYANLVGSGFNGVRFQNFKHHFELIKEQLLYELKEYVNDAIEDELGY